MDWWSFFQQFGPWAMGLVFIVWSGWKRLWVFGWQYDEVRKERDAWRQVALRGSEVAEVFAQIAKQGQ